MDQLILKESSYKNERRLNFLLRATFDGHLCAIYPEHDMKIKSLEDQSPVSASLLFRLSNGIKKFTPLKRVDSKHKKSGNVEFHSGVDRKNNTRVLVSARDPVTGDGGGVFLISEENYHNVMKQLEQVSGDQ